METGGFKLASTITLMLQTEPTNQPTNQLFTESISQLSIMVWPTNRSKLFYEKNCFFITYKCSHATNWKAHHFMENFLVIDSTEVIANSTKSSFVYIMEIMQVTQHGKLWWIQKLYVKICYVDRPFPSPWTWTKFQNVHFLPNFLLSFWFLCTFNLYTFSYNKYI